MQFASSANTHCILSGEHLPDIINENRKTLRHIHHLRFSPSVFRSPRHPFCFMLPGSLPLPLSSPPPKIKLQRPSTSELSSLVCAFHDGNADDVSSTFCSPSFPPSGSMRAASSRFHGKRGRADVNYRMALIYSVIYEDYFYSILAPSICVSPLCIKQSILVENSWC